MTVYFEDMTPGDELTFGAYNVTEAEILSFAERYDPQWFHTNLERAKEESFYGGLIASGWHTTAMTMRLLVDEHLSTSATFGALGVDELRWPNPTRPGEALSVHVEVLDAQPSESNPDRGIVKTYLETTNQDNEIKLSMKPIVMYEKRE